MLLRAPPAPAAPLARRGVSPRRVPRAPARLRERPPRGRRRRPASAPTPPPPRGDDDADEPPAPTFRDARRKFAEDFWEEVGTDRGGVPFMRERARGSSPARADDASSVAEPSSASASSSGAPAPSPAAASNPSDSNPRPTTFWQRCTLLGLVLGLVMLTWALSTTHWPTVRWLARHPNALLHSPELGWSVAEEAARRLAAPALRFITAWCAVRSHWRVTLAAFVASVVVPVAEGM